MRRILVFAPLTMLLGAACAPGSGDPAPPATPRPQAAASPAAPVAGGASPMKQWPSAPEMKIDPKKQYAAIIATSAGDMKADLFAADAPQAVNNFVFLAREGFYNGVQFHRIMANFMVQTGDPTGSGRGGPGYRFNDELPKEREYERGTLAMANAGPNTQGSQFFICLTDLKGRLQKNYTIFGKLASGLDTLDKIGATPVSPGPGGENSSPTQEVQIRTVTIEEKS